MFQLTSYNIVQFITLIIYAVLVSLILSSKQVRLKRPFSILLFAAVGVSLASFLMNLPLPYEQLVFWKMLAVLLVAMTGIAYAHFIAAYSQKNTAKLIKLGYFWVAVNFMLVGFGYLVQGLNVLENETIILYSGYLIDSLVVLNDLIIVAVFFFIIRVLKNAAEPEERNRIAYLLVGAGFMIVGNFLRYILLDFPYALSHIGYCGNAIIITYTLLRYRLLDIQLLMRKWIVYSGVTICVTLAYLALLLGLSNLLRLLPPQFGIPVTIAMVVLFACLFNWVKAALDKTADRLFYGSRYAHRQMLLNFAGKVSNFINMKEIADALIIPLVKTMRAKQAGLMLPCNGHYSTKFIARLTDEDQIVPVMLSRKSLLIQWLEDEGMPLILGDTKTEPMLAQLSPEDKDEIERFQLEILCPIISKQRLVGILALSKKKAHSHYTREEIDLVAMLAKESAVAIENAQIFANAREKADIDGLTGLYNHRYFQESLDQEIEKCSVSGDDFSLLFIDLDFFKTYNDIYGHVMGDFILKEIGQIIKSSIRDTDTGARYGGDEFAAVLRSTSWEGAKAVGDRIRHKLETSMDKKGFFISCSIGIASWRVDGVLRETIIQAADKALYCAKQAGRNRVCLAKDIDTVEPVRAETMIKVEDSDAVDNIVYALASTVDARDHTTYGHSKEVCRYATELAAALGYSKEGIRRIRAAALLHDIGKLNLPDSILTKREPLTDEDWEMIKNHPELGLNILKYVVGLRDCIDAVLYHHESYDGSGYPKGLKGKDIPLDARIMAIADAYDSMISERCYRETRMTEAEAFKELKRCAGTQFDPELVEIFVKSRKKSLMAAPYEAGI